ncbi:hypothetical protein AALO_G00065070 [Alosa alosa]|uniref:Fibrosin-1-like protein n=1 Tax=Alosa alosa TaxID=278164 RepID=A0AAV6H2N1_9TELE|nr:hypothetical protein AALO_G00065070 [Alosa alosa]
MDGKLKQSRRSRSQRERGRRRDSAGRDARNLSPSSCSDREQTPGMDHASQNGKKAPRSHSTSSTRAPRPPRRKRRESSSQEEDIIDGFAIASFVSLECLEKKNGSMKMPDRKERWEKPMVKRQREEQANGVADGVDPAENGFDECAASLERDRERVKERLLKKTYSKKNKRFKGFPGRPGRNLEEEAMQELSKPHRSNSRDRLSESSTHSLSGRGYSVPRALPRTLGGLSGTRPARATAGNRALAGGKGGGAG